MWWRGGGGGGGQVIQLRMNIPDLIIRGRLWGGGGGALVLCGLQDGLHLRAEASYPYALPPPYVSPPFLLSCVYVIGVLSAFTPHC